MFGKGQEENSDIELFKVMREKSGADEESWLLRIKKLIESYRPIDKYNSQGETLLLAAVGTENLALISLVLSYKPNLDLATATFWHFTPLIQAGMSKDAAIVKILLEQKATPDLLDRTGNSALAKATFFRHSATAAMLMEYGADEDLPLIEEGTTPWLMAKSKENKDVFKAMESVAQRRALIFWGHMEGLKLLPKELAACIYQYLIDQPLPTSSVPSLLSEKSGEKNEQTGEPGGSLLQSEKSKETPAEQQCCLVM